MLWLAYGFDAVNNLGEVRQRLAEHHGRQLLDLEGALRLSPEHALNAWTAGHHLLTEVVVFWYQNIHGTVTFGLIAWLWWRRPDLLPPLRAGLISVNLAALAVFWTWPVAPPRMLAQPSFLDLVAVVGGQSGHWPPGAVSLDANQLSALPSLHIAWAIWSAIVLWRLSGRRRLRAVAVVYPLLTAAAVMATANHYLADAVAGALLAGLAVAGADRVLACSKRRWTGRLTAGVGARASRAR